MKKKHFCSGLDTARRQRQREDMSRPVGEARSKREIDVVLGPLLYWYVWRASERGCRVIVTNVAGWSPYTPIVLQQVVG